ncbi:MAG: hypothetical protein GTO62_05520, partial [Planctomycetales bacterium]|nr:hypothetical protein [Planctomycetales bacterium]
MADKQIDMSDKIKTAAEVAEMSAIPCGRAVHAAADCAPTAEQEPLPPAVAKKPVEQKSPAEWAYQRL